MNRQLFLSSLIVLILFTAESSQNENQTETQVFKRIVYKIDLREQYPDLPSTQLFDITLSKTRTNFKKQFKFILENEKIYFLTTLANPAKFTLKVYLNSFLNKTDNVENLKKIEKVFEAKPEDSKRVHIFEMNVENTLEEIISAENLILEEFENRLWNSTQNNSTCKDCLSIVQILPIADGYKVAIGSTVAHTEMLDEICFLERIPKEYFTKTGLKIDYKKANCYTNKLPGNKANSPIVNSPTVENYILKAFVNVRSKPVDAKRTNTPIAKSFLG